MDNDVTDWKEPQKIWEVGEGGKTMTLTLGPTEFEVLRWPRGNLAKRKTGAFGSPERLAFAQSWRRSSACGLVVRGLSPH